MRIFGQTSPREIKITISIWLILLVVALIILGIIRVKTNAILENIYYVDVPNSSKAQILYDQAQAHAQKVFQLAENLNKSVPDRTSIPSDNADITAAMKNYHLALKIDPFAEFDKSKIRAYETIAQLMDASGNRTEQLNYAARAFISMGNYDNARDYINDAISSSPLNQDANILSAQLMLIENQSTEAVRLLTDYKSSNTLSAKGHFVLSKGFELTGNNADAIENLRAAVSGENDNVRYRIQLANLEDKSGNTNAAIQTLTKGIDLGGSQDAVFMHVLGELYLKSNQPELAVNYLERADKLAPFSGDVQLSLAKAYKNAGKTRQSDSALRRAIQVNPQLRDKLL